MTKEVISESLEDVQASLFGHQHDWLKGHSVTARIEKHSRGYICRVFLMWRNGDEIPCNFEGSYHNSPRKSADEFKAWAEEML